MAAHAQKEKTGNRGKEDSDKDEGGARQLIGEKTGQGRGGEGQGETKQLVRNRTGQGRVGEG